MRPLTSSTAAPARSPETSDLHDARAPRTAPGNAQFARNNITVLRERGCRQRACDAPLPWLGSTHARCNPAW